MAWPSDSARTKNWGTEILTDTDLETQFDLLHTYLNDSLDGSTGHGHTGGTNDGKQIVLTTAVSGILPIANGGTGAANLGNIYPIGCIYTTTVSTNPATVFGFGTWSAFGSGRVLVGLDSGQTEFDTVEETGGSKTHTLTTDEIPSHTHGLPSTTSAGVGNYSTTAATGTTTNLTDATGGGDAHNNLQPYVVVYFFKRTA